MKIRNILFEKKIIFSALLLIVVFRIQAQKFFFEELSNAAISLTREKVTYDPTYFVIKYPAGDVPKDRGVCTDVVIRAYRKLGIDLQVLVHEDMKKNFGKYPTIWGMKKPDKNIDHRRVPNLMTFFKRHGQSLTITPKPEEYLPGDIVCWNLRGGVMHIGIVVDKKSNDGKRPLVVHNIGNGQELEDCLFEYKIVGHYRFQK